ADEPGREAPGLAPHHAGRRCLALQPLCRAGGRQRRGARLMRRLTQAPNLAIAALWVDTLREAGIEASVQRQFLCGAVGELPPDQCLPEIWVAHEEQFG